MSLPSPALVMIVGPTAVGKTQLAIQLAQRLDGEIVSADSRLFYRGMDIGTAKPSAAELAQVRHHLIDVADPDDIWSLTVFQQAARAAIEDIHARGKTALLVGGTGQYIRAVTQGWIPPEVSPDPRLRTVLEALAAERGIYWLHDRLQYLDPLSAERIDARNLRRTVRALEVILTSGRPFSTQRGLSDSPYHLVGVGLRRPRPELYERIDKRIEAMFENGLLNEVQGLLEKGYAAELPTMSAIGYRECVAVLRGEISPEEAKIQMKRATRIFVRRQGNWFKDDDGGIRWFDMGESTLQDVEGYLRDRLQAAREA